MRSAKTLTSHRGRLLALLLAGLGVLLLLAACGGDGGESTPSAQGTRTPAAATPAGTPSAQQTQAPAGTPKPSAGAIDPCALVTKEEVEAAIGTSVTEPEREVLGPMASCYFNDPETPIFRTVSVSVITFDDRDQAKGYFEFTTAGSAERTAVTGIGEDAYWVEEPFNSLEILKDKYDVSIDVSSNGWDQLAVAKELAAKVVGRLP